MSLFLRAASAVVLVLLTGTAWAAAGGVEASLRKMDPATRLVQVCDLAVMDKTSSRKDGMTEHAVIDALGRSRVADTNTAEGDGGAFRRRGKWYQFSYSCTTTPDHMKVLKLQMNIKGEIPRSQWESKGLYP